MKSGIYKLTWNDGTVYVGQALDPVVRYRNHIEKMRSNKHTVKVQGTYNALGEPGMVVLETCHQNHLDLLESLWINHYYVKNSIKCLNTQIPPLPDYCDNLEDHREALVHPTGYLLGHIKTLEVGYRELEGTVKGLRTYGLIMPTELKAYREGVETVKRWKKLGLWDRLVIAWTGKLG
jgi:hypothetical protein